MYRTKRDNILTTSQLAMDNCKSSHNETPQEFKGLHSERGQGILEYILVLVVVVGIILGIMHQFSDAFKQYVQGYFGNYVACLLETGELPALGGEGAEGICNALFEPFSLDKGRPLSEGSGESSDSSSENSPRKKSSGPPKTSQSRRSSRQRPVNRVRPTSSSTSNGDRTTIGASGAKQKRRKTRYKSSSNYDSGYSGSGLQSRRRKRRLKLRGQLQGNNKIKRKDKKEDKLAKKKIKGGGGDSGRRPKKLAFDPKKLRKPAEAQDLSLELSIGDYIRYLLIGGIIIAMFIFIGGQALSIKKGWDKGE